MQKNEFETTKNEFLPYAPIVLVRDLLKNWLVVLVAAVIVGIGAYIIIDQTYRPVYQTEATLVITSRDSTATVFSNLKSTSELAAVFSGLLNSSTLQNVVLEELGMTSVNCDISAAAIEETNLMTLRVSAADPRTAFLVLSSLIENHEIVTYEVIGDIVIEVLQMPVVPTAPVNSQNSAACVQYAVIAAVAACALVLTASYFRDTVRSRKEAEKKLNCWCLGEINHEKKHKTFGDLVKRRKRGLIITNSDISFHFTETIRKIRRRVEQYMEDRKVLMVTSVMENEGKSTIAVNLALSLAKKNHRVLLIDLDLRKPACHKILDYQHGSDSTTDVLTGKVSLSQAAVTEKLSGLDMLLEHSAGQHNSAKITELMVTGKVADVIDEARKTYDFVVLDLPPMSAAPDAEYMIKYADASLLVIQQNLVQAKALNRAISALSKGKAELLGCVLNNVHSSGFPFPDGSGYGYGYGYGKYGAYEK